MAISPVLLLAVPTPFWKPLAAGADDVTSPLLVSVKSPVVAKTNGEFEVRVKLVPTVTDEFAEVMTDDPVRFRVPPTPENVSAWPEAGVMLMPPANGRPTPVPAIPMLLKLKVVLALWMVAEPP